MNIQETYNGAVPSTNLSNPGPSVFVTAAMNSDLSVSLDPTGSILNEGGQVSITVADGSLVEAGSLSANQVNLTTLKGVTAISNPNGLAGNGAEPSAGWDTEMYWPAGYDPYADADEPEGIENIYVSYVANAMFNSGGQYGTVDNPVGSFTSGGVRGTGTGDLGFTEELIGTVGQAPPYSFDEPGGPGEPATPQLVDGEPETGTSLIFFGANVGSPTTYTKADADADSPLDNDFEMNGGNNGYFPLVPVESVAETTASSYPTIGTTTIIGSLTAGSTSVAGTSSSTGLFSGESVVGTGISPGTTIEVANAGFTAVLPSGSDMIAVLVSGQVPVIGSTVSGAYIPAGTTVTGITIQSATVYDIDLSVPNNAAAETWENVTLSNLTLSQPATVTGTERLTLSNASEINADAVFINAMYVDVNEPINVGQPSNWSVNLPASLNSVIQADQAVFNSTIDFTLTSGTNQAAVSPQQIGSLAVGDGVTAAGIPSGTTITSINNTNDTLTLSSNATQSGSQVVSIWEFTLPASAISAGDQPITAQFDALTNQIVANDVDANSGGFIQLEGAIMSTNTLGEITVNSDLGQVTIDNKTSFPLVVNNVAASTSATSTTLSGVDIIDTEQPTQTAQTLFVYQPGDVIDEYQGTASQSLLQLQQGSPAAVINGNSTSYSPLAGLRWQWQLQATLTRTVAPNIPVNPQFFEETPWIFASNAVDGETNDNNPWYYLDANGNPTPADSTGTNSTPFGQLVTGSDSDPIFEEAISGDVLAWYMAYYVYHNHDYGFSPDRTACGRFFRQRSRRGPVGVLLRHGSAAHPDQLGQSG